MQIVRAAAEAGADAAKLQANISNTLTIDCYNEYFRISETLWDGRTLNDLYLETHSPWEWHTPLQKLANSLALIFFNHFYRH